MRLRAIALLLGLGALQGGVDAAQLPGDWTTRNCPCRQGGLLVPHGAVICLKVPGSERLARCDMVENMPNWETVQEGCLLARVAGDGTAGP